MLAQMMRERAVSVQYTPPQETRDAGTALAAVSVALAATGSIRDILAAVHYFRQRFGSVARIDGLPEVKASMEDRLAALDQLREAGKITPEEDAEQRVRILNEL
jgi:hypothetical protein